MLLLPRRSTTALAATTFALAVTSAGCGGDDTQGQATASANTPGTAQR